MITVYAAFMVQGEPQTLMSVELTKDGGIFEKCLDREITENLPETGIMFVFNLTADTLDMSVHDLAQVYNDAIRLSEAID